MGFALPVCTKGLNFYQFGEGKWALFEFWDTTPKTVGQNVLSSNSAKASAWLGPLAADRSNNQTEWI